MKVKKSCFKIITPIASLRLVTTAKLRHCNCESPEGWPSHHSKFYSVEDWIPIKIWQTQPLKFQVLKKLLLCSRDNVWVAFQLREIYLNWKNSPHVCHTFCKLLLYLSGTIRQMFHTLATHKTILGKCGIALFETFCIT